MNALDIITKKKLGQELTKKEISWFIREFVQGGIPNYQVSAWLMAVCLNGMNISETHALTEAMVQSGDHMDLSDIEGKKVDKHSTGGVGDKTSLVVVPMVASCGIKVPKLAGRGLGHTGGTIDKLESIAGFKTNLSIPAWKKQINEIGLAIGSQTDNLVPADKKLYALRDVTATVEEQSLIASSIMSKKIATGADAIVLDVKFGLGSFLPDFKEARNLASLMLDIGKYYKIPTHAIISDMNEPLGYAVGNSLEVKEAMDVLMGKGEKRLTEVCTALAMEMIRAVRKDLSGTVIENMLKEKVRSGAALDTLKSWLLAQGAKMDIVSNPEKLALSPNRIQIKASQDGFVTAVHARMVGMAARLLGAGRLSQKDKIDHGAGIWLHAKTGTRVQKGDPIATMYTKKSDVEMPTNLLLKAFTIDNQPPSDSSVVREILKNSI